MAPTVMCCCVFRLRRGCVLIGAILTALYALAALALAGSALYLYLYDYLEHQRVPGSLRPTYYVPIALTVAAAVVLLHLVFHVLLLVGARRDRPRLLLAWLVFSALAFSAQTSALILGYVAATSIHDWGLLAGMVAISLLQPLIWHWFLVVRAQYLQLRLKAPVERGTAGSTGKDQESRHQDLARHEQCSTESPVHAATTAENNAV